MKPRQGVPPCTARLTPPSARLEERPRHPAGRLGSLRSRQGAVSSPLRGCGPHQPLDPPSTRKRARGPRRGLRGTVGVDGGQGSRSDAQRLGLDAQERPQRPGWWLGVLFPQPPATWRTPRRPPEALLICSCFALFRETPKRAFCSKDSLWLWFLSTANGVCVSAPLLHFGDWYGGTL